MSEIVVLKSRSVGPSMAIVVPPEVAALPDECRGCLWQILAPRFRWFGLGAFAMIERERPVPKLDVSKLMPDHSRVSACDSRQHVPFYRNLPKYRRRR